MYFGRESLGSGPAALRAEWVATPEPPAYGPAYRRLQRQLRLIGGRAAELSAILLADGRAPEQPHWLFGNYGRAPVERIQSLFHDNTETGVPTYDLYHYSDDLKSGEVQAQIGLMAFFGQVLALDHRVTRIGGHLLRYADGGGPRLAPLLDAIRVRAWFFDAFLDTHDIAYARRHDRMSVADADTARHTLAARHKASFAALRANLIDPARGAEAIPRRQIPFALRRIAPWDEGARFINGVYFPKDHATPLMARIEAHDAARMARLAS